MKIIYISNSIIPSRAANSVAVMKMCQAFALNSQEVTLLYPASEEQESGISDIYDFYGVKKCFKTEIISIPRVRGQGFIYSYFAARRAKKENIDLVYTRFLPGAYASCLMGCPTIFESHSFNKDKLDNFIFSLLIKNKKLKGVVVTSETLKNCYVNSYPKITNRIHVAPNGSDNIEWNLASASVKNAKNKLLVGYTGHLYKGKGMEVIARLAPLCPWAEFHIIGGMPKDVSYWRSLLADNNNIKLYGYIPHKEIARYLLIFDVLLAPYQEKVAVYGGKGVKGGCGNGTQWMPLKIFEYMSAGKAIIASDLPVVREVLKHEYNALLAAVDDINDWAQALRKLKDNFVLRNRLGHQAKSDFGINYTWIQRAKKILYEINK
jgi:glycosyltransferase involved in cell wall biosynthesis